MERIIVFLLCVTCGFCADAATKTGRLSNYIDRQSYAYMYPYLSNQMRTELNPGTTVTQTNNPMDIVIRTKRMAEPRRVVSRPTASRSSKVIAPQQPQPVALCNVRQIRRAVPQPPIARLSHAAVVAQHHAPTQTQMFAPRAKPPS